MPDDNLINPQNQNLIKEMLLNGLKGMAKKKGVSLYDYLESLSADDISTLNKQFPELTEEMRMAEGYMFAKRELQKIKNECDVKIKSQEDLINDLTTKLKNSSNVIPYTELLNESAKRTAGTGGTKVRYDYEYSVDAIDEMGETGKIKFTSGTDLAEFYKIDTVVKKHNASVSYPRWFKDILTSECESVPMIQGEPAYTKEDCRKINCTLEQIQPEYIKGRLKEKGLCSEDESRKHVLGYLNTHWSTY